MLPIAALALGACGSIALLVPGLVTAISDFLERGQDSQELASLTGRTGIYEGALALISDHWVIGYGFRASRLARLNEIVDNEGNSFGIASHAHNAFLESMASLGLPGAACALAILVSFLVCALALLRSAPRTVHADGIAEERLRAVEYCAYWPPIFAFSIMDSSFALEINPFVFFFIAVLLDFAWYRLQREAAVPIPSPRRSGFGGAAVQR
jgi:O-antigen ligase